MHESWAYTARDEDIEACNFDNCPQHFNPSQIEVMDWFFNHKPSLLLQPVRRDVMPGSFVFSGRIGLGLGDVALTMDPTGAIGEITITPETYDFFTPKRTRKLISTIRKLGG